MTPKITYTLSSAPPSVNNAYWNSRRGRVKTDQYRRWLNDAAWQIAAQKRENQSGCVGGRFDLEALIPKRLRGDVDNRCKGLLDALTRGGAIRDDKFCSCLTIRRADVEQVQLVLSAAP